MMRVGGRARIEQLQVYRENGITTLAEGMEFDLAKRRRQEEASTIFCCYCSREYLKRYIIGVIYLLLRKSVSLMLYDVLGSGNGIGNGNGNGNGIGIGNGVGDGIGNGKW